MVDIKLTEWANHALPKKSVEVRYYQICQDINIG